MPSERAAAGRQFDVVVIGAGAAGLQFAAEAARRGRSVVVLERANKIAKKVLMSGGGRCNFTNLHIDPDCFLSANPHFCRSALSRYTQWQFIELVDRHGIAWHEKTHGQLFCDQSSRLVVAMLRAECEAAGVVIHTRCDIESVQRNGDFELDTAFGRFQGEALVVAAGGLSVPSLGGSDIGYRIARDFGHDVLPLSAGLVPFVFTDNTHTLCKALAGVSLDARLANARAAFREALLFTHRGLSGRAVLQLSSYWSAGETFSANLLPDEQDPGWLTREKRARPRVRLRRVLAERLPRALVEALEGDWWTTESALPLAEWPDARLREIEERLHDWKLRPAGTEGYRTAEVTLGGVDSAGLSSRTMMSRREDGLFFIGEVVDVTGHLGGYNFQWAWSSAWCAAQAV